MSEEYIYVVISETCTGFAKAIRKFGKIKYNHAAISFDPDFNEIYSFTRDQYNIPVVGGLNRENISRYTLDKYDLDIKVFKVPVTAEQKQTIHRQVLEIADDPEFQYNLYSVIFWPLFKGFKTYKAYTCVEFVAHLLENTDVVLDKKPHKYYPQDMDYVLKQYEIYSGSMLNYRNFERKTDGFYFEKFSWWKILKESVPVLLILAERDFGTLCKSIVSN